MVERALYPRILSQTDSAFETLSGAELAALSSDHQISANSVRMNNFGTRLSLFGATFWFLEMCRVALYRSLRCVLGGAVPLAAMQDLRLLRLGR